MKSRVLAMAAMGGMILFTGCATTGHYGYGADYVEYPDYWGYAYPYPYPYPYPYGLWGYYGYYDPYAYRGPYRYDRHDWDNGHRRWHGDGPRLHGGDLNRPPELRGGPFDHLGPARGPGGGPLDHGGPMHGPTGLGDHRGGHPGGGPLGHGLPGYGSIGGGRHR